MDLIKKLSFRFVLHYMKQLSVFIDIFLNLYQCELIALHKDLIITPKAFSQVKIFKMCSFPSFTMVRIGILRH